jgi:iron(III) transport system substrate-binding protein
VKGTRNLAAARAFVDFLLSVEGQRVAVGMGYMPLRADVAPPEGFPSLAELTLLSAAPADLAATRDADKERFATLFGE